MNAWRLILVFVLLTFREAVTFGQEVEAEATRARAVPSTDVLDADQWSQVDASVKRGLKWLASQQKDDGSFESIDSGQPAVTGLCVMAFLAQGESPIDGPYSEALTRAIDYILKQQKHNGLVVRLAPPESPIPRNIDHDIGQTSVYNHAIGSLALAECYGQCNQQQAERILPAIEKAVAATLEMQRWKGKIKKDEGGWRYLSIKWADHDSDLSITGWQLKFLRSARNSGFEVPPESIDDAVKYIENTFSEKNQVFSYLTNNDRSVTRAMAGAGVLALAHAGKHDSPMATAAGNWILEHDFRQYNNDRPPYGITWLKDRYHYGLLPCSQAMYQLGGKYWDQFFPPLVETLLANQQANGSWPAERQDPEYGNCYTTALCLLALSAPNQMLPIFQR